MDRTQIAGGLAEDVVGQAPIGITVCDPDDGRIAYANDRFLELTGHSRSDLLGHSWETLTTSETPGDRATEVRDAVGTGQPETVELWTERADCEPFLNRLRVEPLFDDDGTLRASVLFHEDVTAERDHRTALQALHRVATEMQREETVDDVCELTVDAAADILEFNMCSVFLAEGEWLVPRVDSPDTPPDGTRPFHVDEGLVGKTYRTGRSEVVDDVKGDETSEPVKETYLSAISIPIGEHGVFQAAKSETNGFDDEDVELAELLLSHTASAIGRIEREQALKRQNDRLESFVDVVSHDLRNPLNVLVGSLEMAAETGDSEHFERGRRAIDRIERLIDDLLDLARQGEHVEDTTTVDVASVAGSAWDTVDTARATLDVGTDASLRCHEGRFRQLLENLFRNAVEHGGEDVTVTVGDIDDGFYVADDGPGIPPDRHESVFEHGFTTSREGTGFGLAIVEGIVTAHDWEISVTESDGGGARFEITGADVVD